MFFFIVQQAYAIFTTNGCNTHPLSHLIGTALKKININDAKASCETRCPYDLVYFTHRRSGVSAIFPMQPATYSSYGFVSYGFMIQLYENIFNYKFTKNFFD